MADDESFEWTFVVPGLKGLDDPRVDELNARGEVVVESHSGLNLISTLTHGPSAVDAARTAIGLLSECDLAPERTYPDLVTRGDIARRIGAQRRQTVDNWVRGERHHSFPPPTHLVGGGIWLWRDVSDWLQRHRIKDLQEDDGVRYPTLADHASVDEELNINRHLSNRYRLARVMAEMQQDVLHVVALPSCVSITAELAAEWPPSRPDFGLTLRSSPVPREATSTA